MAGFKHDVKRYPGFKPFTLLFFAYLYLPIAVVILYSFNNSRLVSVWEGFGLKWYVLALANENLLNALKVSLIVAVIAMTVATTVAYWRRLSWYAAVAFAFAGYLKRLSTCRF